MSLISYNITNIPTNEVVTNAYVLPKVTNNYVFSHYFLLTIKMQKLKKEEIGHDLCFQCDAGVQILRRQKVRKSRHFKASRINQSIFISHKDVDESE